MAEHPAGHLVLKWLIEQDVMLAEAGKEGKKTPTHLHTHCSLALAGQYESMKAAYCGFFTKISLLHEVKMIL